MRRVAVVLVVMFAAACSGDDAPSAIEVCDRFQAVVDAGHRLPSDVDQFDEVLDQAADVDELAGAATNIRASVAGEGADLQASVTGFYRRCREAGWDD